MDRVGKYSVKPFSAARKSVMLVAEEGHRKLKFDALLALDVTLARERMHAMKRAGKDVSFTGWVIKCLAQAVSEHPAMNSYRQGHSKHVFFEDVDITVTIEREWADEVRPVIHMVRRAQAKSLGEITAEIRAGAKEDLAPGAMVAGMELTGFERFVLRSPVWLKRMFVGVFRNNGIAHKKHFGTVAVTAIGMKGKYPGWVIPLGGPMTTTVAVGGITTNPGVVNGQVVPREFLHLTITVDHVVVDGGPMVRFVDRFTSLIESGGFLDQG